MELAVRAMVSNKWNQSGLDPAERVDFNGDGTANLADLTLLGDSNGATDAGLNDPLCLQPRGESGRGRGGLANLPLPLGLCDFGHQGLYYDKEFGLYYNRRRMYHPTLRIFIQRDPLGYVDGMSLYQYCGSLPLSRVDPTGMEPPGAAGYSGKSMPLGSNYTAYVEAGAHTGIGELKILDPKGVELARLRYDRATGVLQEITEHGGKPLRRLSQRALKKIADKLPRVIEKMIARAGGAARTATYAGASGASEGALLRVISRAIGALAIMYTVLDMTATTCAADDMILGPEMYEVSLDDLGITPDDIDGPEADTPVTRRAKHYTVHKGDTLWGLMIRFGWNPRDTDQMQEWLDLNPEVASHSEHWLFEGRTVSIPQKKLPVSPGVGD